MQCPLCGHPKAYKHGKIASGKQRYHCAVCKRTFTETFDTLYYRRQTPPETIRHVLQSHAEGSSLRGIARTTGLTYNTVVALVRAASQHSQQLHKGNVLAVDTDDVSVDEMWSFVKKSKNTVSQTS